MSEEGSLKEGTGGVTGSFKEDDSQWQDENESNMSEADTETKVRERCEHHSGARRSATRRRKCLGFDDYERGLEYREPGV